MLGNADKMNSIMHGIPSLLERAHQLIAHPPRVSDYEGDGGAHPNDYRAVVQEWVDDYEKVISKLPFTECPHCKGLSYNEEMSVCEICNFVD